MLTGVDCGQHLEGLVVVLGVHAVEHHTDTDPHLRTGGQAGRLFSYVFSYPQLPIFVTLKKNLLLRHYATCSFIYTQHTLPCIPANRNRNNRVLSGCY